MKLSFGTFGERRGSNWSGTPSSGDWTAIGNTTRDGFTQHEHLDSVGLIHMNGRVYDPKIGRFVSPDPFIDWGLGTQGVNRYGYVGNNPLSRVDPTGFTCQPPPDGSGMSDEEIMEDLSRCYAAYESAGWGSIMENERWCALLDVGCQIQNYQQTLASLADALTYEKYTLREYQLCGEERWGWADGAVVIATRLTGNERYEWEQYLGLPPGASLIRTTLPDGRVGGVASTVTERIVSVGPAADPVSLGHTGINTAGKLSLAGATAWASEYWAMAGGLSSVARTSGYAGGIVGVTSSLEAFQRRSIAESTVGLAMTTAGVLLATGVITVSTPVWGPMAIGAVGAYTLGNMAIAIGAFP